MSALLNVGAALAAGWLVKKVSKKKGSQAHQLGSPVAALVAGGLAAGLQAVGLDVGMDDIQAAPDPALLLQGGAGAVLLQSIFSGGKKSLKKG